MAVQTELIIIGGSAGSLPVLTQILKALPGDFTLPIVVVIHRQKNVVSEFAKILSESTKKNGTISEPDDKEPIQPSHIYLAPQNYHLLIEQDRSFSLDYSEAVKFSRPSIDVSFESAATVYKESLVAILLSGANNDGAAGLESVVNMGGTAIVQEPSTAEFKVMPLAAIETVSNVQVLSPQGICRYINGINIKSK